MSSTMKFGLLALISTAAAIPHYGHGKYHKSSSAGGYAAGSGTGLPAYPTGGWYGGKNSTAPSGTAVGTGVYPDDKTTTIDETSTSVTQVTSTIYASPVPSGSSPSSVGVVDIGSSSGVCGPDTVYVTATNQVTVTVTAGGAPSSSKAPSSSPDAASSSFASASGGYEAPSKEASLSVSKTPVESATPSPSETSSKSPSKVYETPVETPKVSEIPVEKPTETPSPSEKPSEKSSETYVLPSSSAVEEKVSISIPVKEVASPTPTPEAPSSSEVAKPSSSSVEAKPSPSSSPSYGGGKRGLAYNDVNLCSSFAGKATWSYNWGSSPGGKLPEGISFAPMPWVKNEDASSWLQKVDEAVAAGSKVVMGFNEVDHPDQANMSPDVACKNWESYMNPVAAAHPDVTILGPSVTNNRNDPAWGLGWYKTFAEVCPQAVYHAINVHFYDIYQEGEGQASTVNRFIDLIESAASQSGKQVWVTEFGLNPGASPDQVTKFLTACLEYLDSSDKVGGYSYFMVGTGENQLNAGNGLSSVGQIYASG